MHALLWLLIYPLIGLIVLGFGLLLYFRASLSRRTYHCPNCNERIRVELMEAIYCNACGAPLRNRDPREDDYHDFAP